MARKTAATKARRRGASVRAMEPSTPRKPRPGRQPTQPLVVLYQEGAHTVCAMLVHPSRPDVKIESARGQYAALGAFQDQGYGFGRVKEAVPDWASDRVPSHCTVLGCASITSVPFV
jgi:hypothetical protein